MFQLKAIQIFTLTISLNDNFNDVFGALENNHKISFDGHSELKVSPSQESIISALKEIKINQSFILIEI